MTYYNLDVADIKDFDVLISELGTSLQVEILSEDGCVSLVVLKDGDIVTSEILKLP